MFWNKYMKLYFERFYLEKYCTNRFSIIQSTGADDIYKLPEILVIFRNGVTTDRCENSREGTWRISWKYQDISQSTLTANIRNILSKPDWMIGLLGWSSRCEDET